MKSQHKQKADSLLAFAGCLYNEDDTVEIRCIVPRDIKERLINESLLQPEKARKQQREQAAKLAQQKHARFVLHKWCQAKNLPTMAKWCAEQNSNAVLKYGIYAGANPRRKHGGTKREDISCYRTVFVDIDDTHNIDEVQGRIKAAGLPEPTLIVDSGHGYHVYWRLTEPIEELERGENLARRLVGVLGGDPKVKDPPRVMRLPGFWNTKEPVAETKIVEADPARRYFIEELERCLPEAEQAKPQTDTEAGTPNPSDTNRPDRIGQALSYSTKWDGVSEGAAEGKEGRNSAAQRHAACLRNDFHLTEDEARPILEAWNFRNDPPLDQSELDECLHNGGKYGTHVKGSKLRPRQRHLSDAGNGERLYDYFGNMLRYCPELGWCAWDERRWNFQIGKTKANQYALRTVRNIAKIEANVPSLEKDERKRLFNWSIKSESQHGLASLLACAQNIEGFVVHQHEFDKDPFLFCCANGVIDLRTGKIRDFDPKDLISKISPVAYMPDDLDPALVDFWNRHLALIFDGNTELISYVQRVAGYILTGSTVEEKLFMGFGPTSGGKTTTIEALKTVSGDYCRTANFESFCKKQFGGIPNDIARLAGARFVPSVEVDDGRKLAEGLVKQITGNDSITARFLRKEFFEYRPQFKLFLVCNDAPQARDDDDALWRRIVLIPFDYSIPPEKRDPAVKEKLADPKVGGPVILAWMVQGCLAWQKQGLKVPKAVAVATQQYRESNDKLKDFLLDECELIEGGYVPVRDLREAYTEYCKRNGVYEISAREFCKRLRQKGCTEERRYDGAQKRVRCWGGLVLKNDRRYENGPWKEWWPLAPDSTLEAA